MVSTVNWTTALKPKVCGSWGLPKHRQHRHQRVPPWTPACVRGWYSRKKEPINIRMTLASILCKHLGHTSRQESV